MKRSVILALRGVLVVIGLGLLAAQLWFFPVLSGELAYTYPEVAWLRWPMLVAVVCVIACVQVALASVWGLLSMVEDDSVFSTRAFRFIDVIVAAALGATIMVAVINAYMSFGLNANPPALMFGLTALTMGGAAVALLMVVMKGLLVKASTMQVELSEVI